MCVCVFFSLFWYSLSFLDPFLWFLSWVDDVDNHNVDDDDDDEKRTDREDDERMDDHARDVVESIGRRRSSAASFVARNGRETIDDE